MCVLIFSTTLLRNISHSKRNWAISPHFHKCTHIGLHVKCPLFLSDFKETWIFSTDFEKKNQVSNFMKIHPAGAELFRCGWTDGHTDMTMLIFAFRNFANAPEDRKKLLCAAICIPSCCSEQEWNNDGFQRKKKNLIIWFKNMLNNFALTLMSRARFDARYLSSSYLQDLLSMTQQPLVCHALLAIEASRLHSDTAHTVRLLWTGDQPNAQTSTWQHKHSKETDLHALGGIRTRNPSKRADAELRLRRRGLWGQLFIRYYWVFMIKIIYKPMNSILDRHFFTKHCTAIRQLLAPRIASLLLVSTEQNGNKPAGSAAVPHLPLWCHVVGWQQRWT